MFPTISKAKLFYTDNLISSEIQGWFTNCSYVLKTMRHEIKMHCPECTQAQIHHAAKDLDHWLWKNMLNLNPTFSGGKKKGGEGAGSYNYNTENVRCLKRFSTESRWNLWSSCFITHSDPAQHIHYFLHTPICTAHKLVWQEQCMLYNIYFWFTL